MSEVFYDVVKPPASPEPPAIFIVVENYSSGNNVEYVGLDPWVATAAADACSMSYVEVWRGRLLEQRWARAAGGLYTRKLFDRSGRLYDESRAIPLAIVPPESPEEFWIRIGEYYMDHSVKARR